MTIRVLVAEDHEAWRRYISSALRNHLQCQVVGEAADGWEAVQKAERLKPDLIVLDVELPTLNGIEAARRILTLAPDSKILFVSGHGALEIVEAALGTGADGYIIKSDAGSDLLPAVDAIIQGKRFIGDRFGGRVFERTRCDRVPQQTRRHEVDFCSDELSVLDNFARFAGGALETGSAVIVVANGSCRNTLHQRLQASGLDIDLAIEEGRYVPLDVADSLSNFMVNGWPDEARFWRITTPLMVAAAKASKHGRVVACGECSPTLWREGRAAAAIRVENLWDEFARAYEVDVLCGYSLTAPRDDEEKRIVERICAAHSAVRGSPTRD